MDQSYALDSSYDGTGENYDEFNQEGDELQAPGGFGGFDNFKVCATARVFEVWLAWRACTQLSAIARQQLAPQPCAEPYWPVGHTLIG